MNFCVYSLHERLDINIYLELNELKRRKNCSEKEEKRKLLFRTNTFPSPRSPNICQLF